MTYEAVAIGGSAGGLNALEMILQSLPADFKLPIFIVLHRLPAADDLLSLTLQENCRLKVKEATPSEAVQPGWVYLAPANYHLLIESDKTLSLSVDAKVCFSRPAIDVLFESAADTYQTGLIGIILTGANEDGTVGLKRIKATGGLTIAQHPATAEAPLMPSSAIQENIVDNILSLSDIASFLIGLTMKRNEP